MNSETRRKAKEAMAALRATVAGCDLALLADRESGMILCTEAEMVPPQDAIDRLARLACGDLEAPWVAALAPEAVVVSTRGDGGAFLSCLMRPGAEEMIVCRHETGAVDRDALQSAAGVVFDAFLPAEGEEA